MLTIAAIEAAKPKEKPYKLTDGQGLYVLVNPNGSKLFRFKFYFKGKEKLASLGSYPAVSLKAARIKRDEFKRSLASGENPIAPRNGATFETVAREYVLSQATIRKPRYLQDTLRRLELNVFPHIGKSPIASLEAPDLLAALRTIEKRGSLEMAARVRALAGQVFRYGIASGHCKRDPAADLKGALKPHKPKHHPALKVEQVPELIAAIRTYDGEAVTRLAVHMLLLTAVRTQELIGARWEEFNVSDASSLWTVPGSRMKMAKDHLVPLSSQALSVLEELRSLQGVEDMGERFVFASPFNPLKAISNNTILYALYRMGFKGRQTGHGFRTLFSSVLNEHRELGISDFSSDVIERQLDHCERNEIRGAYNRSEYLPARRKALQYWADWLSEKGL